MLAEIMIAWITVLALAISVISVVSYRRSGSRKMLLVTSGFTLFFVKGLVLSMGILSTQVDWKSLVMYSILLDTIILVTFFAAIVLEKK